MLTRTTHLAPMWFMTSRSAATVLANAPAIAGVLCPLSTAFCATLSGVLFFPVRCCGSTCGGRYASVASWMSSETGTRTQTPLPCGLTTGSTEKSMLRGGGESGVGELEVDAEVDASA